jgi:hypothetical protein
VCDQALEQKRVASYDTAPSVCVALGAVLDFGAAIGFVNK